MKSRTWRKIGVVTGILALFLVGVGIAASRLLDLNRHHEFLVSVIEKNTGGQVTLGHITWGIAHHLWLEVDEFSITDASAFTGDVKLTRLYASISIPRLLTKKVVLKKLQLESPEIKFRLEPGTQDAGLPADNAKYAGVHLPVEVDIEQLAIEVDRLELSDSLTLPGETLVHVFSDVELAATSVAPEAVMAFNVSLQDKEPSGLGSLKAQGTFSGLTRDLTLENPELKLKAVLNALSADAIKPYLKNEHLDKQLAGSLSMHVNYEGDLGKNLRAQGSVDLGQLSYSNPALWDAPLSGQNTTLTFQIGLDPQNLTAEKITLKQGALSLRGQGVLHDWNKAPVIRNAEFSSELPLGDLVPLMPWKQIGEDADLIRSLLEGGGKLVINKLTLPEISLEKLPATVADRGPGIAMTAQIAAVDLPAAATSADDQITLDLQAQIDAWGSNPTFTLKNVKTSQLSLPLLARMIPWVTLDPSAKPVKAIMESGGFITITALSLPAIELSKQPTDPKQLLAEVVLAADLIDITVPRVYSSTAFEGINGRVTLNKNVLLAENIRARIGPVALPVLNIRATDIADHFKLILRGKGPLQVAAAGDQQIEQLLLEHGLKNLTLSADVDVRADFDQHKPEDWTASGSIFLKDVSAQTHPVAVVMDQLQGKVMFSRQKALTITAQDISARINQTPVHLSGKISGIGSPDMLVNAHATAKGLDLAHMAELVPALKNIKLAGMLDMDVDVHVPYSAPGKSRLKGAMSVRAAGFQLAAPGLAVAKGDMDLQLSGNGATIQSMTMTVNEQQVDITGRLSNPVEPDIKVILKATDLNIDRLLQAEKAGKTIPAVSNDRPHQGDNELATTTKTGSAELPPLAHKLTADVQVKADRGQYKGVHFEKLGLGLLYRQGMIESFNLSAGVNKGVLAAKGSADIKDLERIRFTVDPNITALPLHAVTPLLGTDSLPLSGPLTLKGQLRGRTGSSRELLGSLDGKLDASLGPGSVSDVGKAGELIAKLSSMSHIRSLFSGRLFRDLSNRGLPFERLTAQASFEKGTLNLGKLHFGSDVMTVDGQGTIDLINEKLNMQALLVPLVTMDAALNYVPLVGGALQDVSRIRIDIDGPLGDPNIHTAEVRQIGKGIETEIEQPEKTLEGVGKGLEKVF